LQWYDYGKARESVGIEQYAAQLVQIAAEAYKSVSYSDWVPLGMLERRLTLRRRTPDSGRLSWARKIAEPMRGRKPKNRTEVYALEQICLHEDQERELKLQVVRIGDLAITGIPCEVYGITGLKIKAQSPLRNTFNIELANGCEGYIPPPEQHVLGGYTTWPARSAGLEVQAEPRIVETVLSMLEEVSGGKRRVLKRGLSAYDKAVLKCGPLAYWRMDEIQGPYAADAGGNGNRGVYEGGVAFYLAGPGGPGMTTQEGACRCAHFAGGRVKARLPGLGKRYSVEMWIWNGLPADVRELTGFVFSRGPDASGKGGDCLGIGGVSGNSAGSGKIVFSAGDLEENLVVGRTHVPLRTWIHVALVRDNRRISIYLNGNKTPEIDSESDEGGQIDSAEVIIGGCGGHSFNFEGKIAGVAVYDRPLSPDEIRHHYGQEQQEP